MNKISLFFISILFMLMIFGCGKNKPLPGSYERIIGNVEGAIVDTVLTLETGAEKSYSKFVNTSSSNELLLGSYEQYNSGIYLQFAAPGDSLHIKSADLVMSIKGKTAPGDSSFWDSFPQATVNVFLADTLWDETNPPIKDWNLQLSSATIFSDSTNKISIPLDTTLLNQWNDDESDYNSYGFWLESEDAEFIQIYHSLNSYDETIIPKIDIYYSYVDTGGVTIDTNKVIYVSEDAFVLLNTEQDLNLDPDLIYVGKGLAFYNNFYFDLSLFDSTIHINRATLELTINKENSIRDLSGLSDAYLFRQAVEWIDGAEIDPIEGLGASYPTTVTDSTITFSIAPSIQSITTNTYVNYGFYFKLTSDDQTISRIAFYSSKSDPELQPKIKIYYSTPAKQEF
ncbi:hypothetical protein H8E88_20160 [candidate division KSB1 bacterium]|nr:hypothetical protein [candidate division KSB1 bacterium]MBL7094255.1 hypothetical protein [candidate division KSB1 bacterium]